VMALWGRKQLKEFHPVPEETVETLKEDVQWLKSRKS
jgi:Putative Actinobacterial Holin-X, holin superfamily III